MKQVQRSEILPLGEYEAIRDRFRSRIIAEKRRRRLNLGDKMSVVFENHDTMLLQVQEMLRTERISKESAIQHELATYNELVPDDDELSMTLFIEIPEKAEREQLLTALAGMEDKVFFHIDGHSVAALAADRDGAEAGRTTAVQYYRIKLPAGLAGTLRKGEAKEVELSVEHPAYQQRVSLRSDTRQELASDLAW